MQVHPIEPPLKAPGTKRLKLKCDIMLLTSAFKFNLRRYTEDVYHSQAFQLPIKAFRLPVVEETQ